MSDSVLYLLVLLSAFGHALWNAFLKGSGDRLVTMTSIRIVGFTAGAAILPFTGLPNLESIPWLGAATLALYAYYALLIRGYGAGDLSFVYPLARGVAPVFLTGVAFLAIAEQVSSSQLQGIALICTGIIVLALAGGGSTRGLGIAATIGGAIATYSFMSGVGVRLSGQFLAFNALLEVACGAGFIGFALARRGWSLVPPLLAGWQVGLGAGILSFFGFMAYLVAAQSLPLGAVAAVRESSALFAVAIGVLAFKEGFGPRRFISAAMIASGVAVLAL